MVAPKATLAAGKKAMAIAQPVIGATQRLFADALLKAGTRPALPRGKLAEDLPVAGMVTAPIAFVASSTAPPPTIAPPDPALALHIERIAAAIAEVRLSGATAEIELLLPAGPTPIDGAIIGRNAGGALHIVLTTHAEIAPAVAAQLQGQLTDRLLRRDIRVAKMGLQRIDRRTSDA